MSAGRRSIEDLFESALERPPSERGAFLEEACGNDPPLFEEVAAMLRAHDRAGGVLESRLPVSAASLMGEPDSGPAPGPPGPRDRRIGPYRVLEELGRGGMGVVYLAQRDDGQFRRRVALKVIRDDDPALAARIVAERQILASLDHPNIARLYDGGVSDDGRPYLAMEHVGGLPIDLYCDRMRLSVRERVRLFVTVARAVEHAHRNLVIHRDLKPSNILVTADGRPKLLDFGIAKLLNPALASFDAPVTRHEGQVLTPDYASPEQLRGETLTTASDVYSLGVVLHVVLTGRPPYDVAGRTVPAILDAVLQQDPERPSSRVLRPAGGPDRTPSATASELAQDRQTTPERLQRTLRGDLDAIVLMLLRKEPARRYGSAEQLAQDLERWLRGEPVLAHRGGRWYRAGKLLRRHKVPAIAAVLVGLSLVVGTGAATWQARLAGRERDRANTAARESQEVSNFLLELFRAGDPGTASGDVTARDLLRRGALRADALADQPVVQARMLDVVGRLHYELGLYDDAGRLLDRAISLRRQHLGADHPDLAESLIHRAWVHRSEARPDEAESLVREALDIDRRAVPPEDPRIGDALFELGWLRAGTEQEALYRDALDVYRLGGADPAKHLQVMQGLGTNLRRQGRLVDALAIEREALRFANDRLGPEHPTTGYAMIHLADQVRDIAGDPTEALALLRRGIDLQTRAYGPNSMQLIHGLNSLAWTLAGQSDHAAAEALYRRALDIRRAALGPLHPTVAYSLLAVADELVPQGRLAEADSLDQSALEIFRASLSEGHPALADAFEGLAHVREAQGRIDEGEALLRQAVAARRGKTNATAVGESHRTLGRYLIRHGRYAAAEPELLEAVRLMGDLGDLHPNAIDSKRALFELYTAWGRPEDAARWKVPPGGFIPY